MDIQAEFTPLSNYILLDMVIEEGDNKIILPDSVNKLQARQAKAKTIVVAVSTECDGQGNPFVRMVKVGDRVLCNSSVAHSGNFVKIYGKDYLCVRETEVLGIYAAGYTGKVTPSLDPEQIAHTEN